MLDLSPPPLADAPAAQQQEPQQLAFACSAAELQLIEARLRQAYRQLSVAIHPDKCSHPLASKVGSTPVDRKQADPKPQHLQSCAS